MVETHEQSIDEEGTHGAGVFIALVPWVLFTIVAEHGTLKLASLAALVIAVGISLPGIIKGRPKLLELGAVVAFIGFTVVAFAADASLGEFAERYARAIAAALLALIAFASLASVPFTEQYAREEVPQEHVVEPQVQVGQPPPHVDVGNGLRGDGPLPHRRRSDRHAPLQYRPQLGHPDRAGAVGDQTDIGHHRRGGGLIMRLFKDDDFQFGLETVLGGAYRQASDETRTPNASQAPSRRG